MPTSRNRRQLRTVVALAAVCLLALTACGSSGTKSSSSSGSSTAAKSKTIIKIAAIEPLSGALAASGNEEVKGEKFAIQQINASGGIKSLGGAQLQLVTGDAGSTAAQATATAQTMLGGGGFTAATGSWYSSLTLAATPVAELNHIPWITSSGSDDIVAKNPQYVFKTSGNVSVTSTALLAMIKQYFTTSGQVPVVAIAGDDNVANTAAYAQYNGYQSQGLIKIGTQKVWTPPLADVAPVAAAIVAAHPSVILLSAASVLDETALLQSLQSRGSKAPIIGLAASWDDPSYLTTIGAAAMERIMTPNSLPFPGKGSEATVAAYVKFTGDPWMSVAAAGSYVNMEILAAAIDTAASSNPDAVAKALHTMELKNYAPLTGMFTGWQDVKYGANGIDGQRANASYEITEWIDGKPQNIYPSDLAEAQPKLG